MGKSKRNVDIFTQAYDKIKSQIEGRTFKASDLIHFATIAMQIVETYPSLSGPAKKDLVVRLAVRLVEDFVPDEQKQALLDAINLLLPAVIDQIVAATKGQLGINIENFFKTRCSCIGKK